MPSQNITDPALGDVGLALLQRGYPSKRVLIMVIEAGAYPEHRRITVVDGRGRTAQHSVSNDLGRNAVASRRLCIAAGNSLKHEEVPAAMIATFEADPGAELAERLLLALEAGKKSGGEEGAVRSTGLKVVEDFVWPTVDLRVDWHDKPIQELRAPSYGVPNDP